MAGYSEFKPEWDKSPVPAPRAADAPALKQPDRGGARYRVVRPCFVKPTGATTPRQYHPGDIVETADSPSTGLLPLNASAIAAKRTSISKVHFEHLTATTDVVIRMAESLPGWSGRNSDEARAFVKNFKEGN